MCWLVASVTKIAPATVAAVSLGLEVPGWPGHRAGQQADSCLTTEDGHSAQRSYSITSGPGQDHVRLTVVCLGDDRSVARGSMIVDAVDRSAWGLPSAATSSGDACVSRPVLPVVGGSGSFLR
jgi:hypothetical protein